VPGEVSLWPSLTGTETLHLLGRVQGRVDAAYRDLLLERFEFDPSKKVRAYSKGNRQKLILIAGLMSRADLLLLDEPTSGLDPLMERAFRVCVDEARERGQTIFLSSHILAEVEAVCDRIAILRAADSRRWGRSPRCATCRSSRSRPSSTAARPTCPGFPRERRRGGGQPVRCQVTGSVEPLLAVLAAAGVRHLTSREPSLEELFLAHYSADGSGRDIRCSVGRSTASAVRRGSWPSPPRGGPACRGSCGGWSSGHDRGVGHGLPVHVPTEASRATVARVFEGNTAWRRSSDPSAGWTRWPATPPTRA
jgi:ABC-2 type transport system ATP-binding protein